MAHFKTPYNYVSDYLVEPDYGVYDSVLPSETTEDQSYTVEELYKRFVTGVGMPSIGHDAYYEDDEDYIDPRRVPNYDLVDYTEEMHGIAANVASLSVVESKTEDESKADEPAKKRKRTKDDGAAAGSDSAAHGLTTPLSEGTNDE